MCRGSWGRCRWRAGIFGNDRTSKVQAFDEELPELTDAMLARAKVNKGGRPVSANPRKLISLRLPADVIERWKATGAGWQTRMAERLSQV